MWCKHCGAEIIRIHTMGGPAVCWASPYYLLACEGQGGSGVTDTERKQRLW